MLSALRPEIRLNLPTPVMGTSGGSLCQKTTVTLPAFGMLIFIHRYLTVPIWNYIIQLFSCHKCW